MGSARWRSTGDGPRPPRAAGGPECPQPGPREPTPARRPLRPWPGAPIRPPTPPDPVSPSRRRASGAAAGGVRLGERPGKPAGGRGVGASLPLEWTNRPAPGALAPWWSPVVVPVGRRTSGARKGPRRGGGPGAAVVQWRTRASRGRPPPSRVRLPAQLATPRLGLRPTNRRLATRQGTWARRCGHTTRALYTCTLVPPWVMTPHHEQTSSRSESHESCGVK